MQPTQDEQVRALRTAVTRRGLATAAELTRALGVSQPTLSRLVRRVRAEVLVVGRGRATRYAWRRIVPGVDTTIPIYEMPRRDGRPRHLADLHPAAPDGFVLEGREPGVTTRWYDDLPWFLQDLRPAGWLGRQVPALHPELGLPPHLSSWRSDHALRYLVAHGFDGVGALVVGSESFRRAVAAAREPFGAVPAAARPDEYAARAAAAVQQGPAGSSAGGEEPKFLALRDDGDRQVPVLVKFSPAAGGEVAERRRDLLVCEHLALCTLADHGHAAARSEILTGAARTFLEVERFDRDGPSYRVGQIALAWADAEHVGSALTAWTDTTAALARRGLLTSTDDRTVRWRQAFGHLVGNSDMHAHNVSLRLDGVRIVGVAPAYDMLPMAYAPVPPGELRSVTFAPTLPGAADADIAGEVVEAAVDFWGRVATDRRISEPFRRIAAVNAALVAHLRAGLAWLPAR